METPNPYDSPGIVAPAPRSIVAWVALRILGWALGVGLFLACWWYACLGVFGLTYPGHTDSDWVGRVAVLFPIVFSAIWCGMVVVLARRDRAVSVWSRLLPALLWTAAIFVAGEIAFTTICTVTFGPL